jgi:hypothetical protein
MPEKIKNTVLLAVSIIALVFIGLFIFTRASADLGFNKTQDMANELKNKGLFPQAVEEYKDFLLTKTMSSALRSSICYIIAETYNNEIRDYDNALAWYLKAKYYNPRSPIITTLNEKIIACLENSGRNVEAKGELSSLTALDKDKTPDRNAVIVAKADGRPMTLKEFEKWYATLPEALVKQMPGLEGKKQLLRNFVAKELLYQSAVRRGFDKDKDILEQVFGVKKSLMVQKVLQDEVLKNARIDESDLRNFYQAHQKEFYDKLHGVQPSFEEVKKEVYQALMAEKVQNLSQAYVSKLLGSSDVRIIDENIR